MENKGSKPTRRERRAAERDARRAAGPSGAATRRPLLPSGLGGLSRARTSAVLALGLLVAVSYFPALRAGFVWDDVIFSEEPVLRAWSALWSIWFDPADIRKEGHYWPVVYTSFWLEHKLWGLAPLGYHAVNLLLHWVNSLLVWRLLSRLAVPGAWAAAAVFAVHPLHVESVAWVIERKDLLSALFYLTAALTWFRFVETPSRGRYLLALALFTAGLLSKSVVVTLPAALLIWHWWQRQRVTAADLLRLAPFFAVGLAVTLGDLWYYTSREPLDLGYSFIERVLIACRALWFYAGKLLWPTELAVIYPLWDVRAGDLAGWAYVAAAVAAAALLWLGRHRLGRGPLAAALYFAVTLSPVLGFVDYGYMQFAFVADRFQYLAGIAAMALAVGGAAWWAERLPRSFRLGARGLLAAVLAVFGVLTWSQARIYKDETVFFSHIVSLNPNARDAYLNLAHALIEKGRHEEGLAAARIAVEQRPDFASAHSNVGLALLNLNRFDEAHAALRRGLEIDPRHRSLRQNLAETLRQEQRYAEAVEAYRATLKIDSRYALAHAGLGDSLFQLKRYREAAAALERSLALDPHAPIAGTLHVILGQALQALRRFDDAARHYQRAARIDPGDARPLVQMADLRHAQGRAGEARDYWLRASRLSPDDRATRHNLAEGLRKQKRYAEAVEAFRALLATDPDYAGAHAGLGQTLFQMKRYDEALASLSRALTLDPRSPSNASRHVLAGRSARALGRGGVAAGHFERALALDPRNGAALDSLAAARFGQKRYEDALALYRRLHDAGPGNAQTHSNMGAVLYYLGRTEEALRSFERALALEPDLATARTGLREARRALAKPRP